MKTTMNFRLKEENLEKLKTIAKTNRWSVSATIDFLIDIGLNQFEQVRKCNSNS